MSMSTDSSSSSLGPKPLQGKLAIVTGASRGIGKAICENLARKGCNLIMCYTSASSGTLTDNLAEALSEDFEIDTLPVRADMSDPSCGATIIEAMRPFLNTHPVIHILINNAGVAGNATLADASPDQLTADFQKQYATNVLGPLLLTQAVRPYLPQDRSGRIVNVSSVSSSLGFAGQSVYGGTKAALEAMTRTWARELAFNATVNAVNPGPVATDMYGGTSVEFQRQIRPWAMNAPGMQVSVELDGEEAVREVESGPPDGLGTGGRAGTPGEVAGVVGMLVGWESQWCTGSVICCNGGMRMSP